MTGSVSDINGPVVATVAVAGIASVNTGPDGSYTIANIPAGGHIVTISAFKHVTLHTEVGIYANDTTAAKYGLVAEGAIGKPPKGGGGQLE